MLEATNFWHGIVEFASGLARLASETHVKNAKKKIYRAMNFYYEAN